MAATTQCNRYWHIKIASPSSSRNFCLDAARATAFDHTASCKENGKTHPGADPGCPHRLTDSKTIDCTIHPHK